MQEISERYYWEVGGSWRIPNRGGEHELCVHPEIIRIKAYAEGREEKATVYTFKTNAWNPRDFLAGILVKNMVPPTRALVLSAVSPLALVSLFNLYGGRENFRLMLEKKGKGAFGKDFKQEIKVVLAEENLGPARLLGKSSDIVPVYIDTKFNIHAGGQDRIELHSVAMVTEEPMAPEQETAAEEGDSHNPDQYYAAVCREFNITAGKRDSFLRDHVLQEGEVSANIIPFSTIGQDIDRRLSYLAVKNHSGKKKPLLLLVAKEGPYDYAIFYSSFIGGRGGAEHLGFRGLSFCNLHNFRERMPPGFPVSCLLDEPEGNALAGALNLRETVRHMRTSYQSYVSEMPGERHVGDRKDKRRYFYDWEYYVSERFVIFPLSIGIVPEAEDEEPYYAVIGDYIRYVPEDSWVAHNVISCFGDAPRKSADQVAKEILNYIKPAKEVELWSYQSEHDQHLFSSLFGGAETNAYSRFHDKGINIIMPLDLAHLRHRMGWPALPQRPERHHALADAQWHRQCFLNIKQLALKRGVNIDSPVSADFSSPSPLPPPA